jgi:hypothetical protein
MTSSRRTRYRACPLINIYSGVMWKGGGWFNLSIRMTPCRILRLKAQTPGVTPAFVGDGIP